MPLIRTDKTQTPSPASDPLQVLTTGTSEERWSAARALAKTPGSVRQLGDALKSETDARVREALLTSLTHIQTAEAVEAVLPFIRSDDAALRTGALDALGAMPAAVQAYIPNLLADPDPDVRLLICDIVRRLPGDIATRHLCALLERETAPNVCAAAIDALSEVGESDALPVLENCAARFADEPFLLFAIKIASQRISGGEPGSELV